MNIKSSESRTARPILVKVTESDRKRLKQAARKHKMPMTTFVYACIKQILEQEYADQGGAQ